ncbi:MAG: hypothetical protein ACHQT9_04535 [Candidatus Saccharimonadales bacterium]
MSALIYINHYLALSGNSLPQPNADSSSIQTVLTITFGVIGAMAVLMVAISGLRYILSDGDPQKISRAKNSIIYALVGVAIAIAAEAIVHFVLFRV